jgi:hypothetical protein
MKNKLIVAVMMAATVFLSGCIEPKTVVDQKLKEYEIVGIKKPKRFKVDIRDVETGQVYFAQTVSKRCNVWDKLQMGSKWKFTEITYKDKYGNLSYEVSGVTGLCDSIRAMK